MLRFSIDPMLDDFIRRHRAAEAATTDERDAVISARFPTISKLYFGEQGDGLTVSADGEVMRAYGAGPTILARELLRARGYLAVGDGLFTAQNDQGNYGICLRFRRTGDRVSVARTYEDPPLSGPSQLEVSWDEFVEGISHYMRWFLNEHVTEASWLMAIPEVQHWLQTET